MDWRRTVAWFRSAHGDAADRVRHILSLSSVPCRHAAWQSAIGEEGSCEQVALEVAGKPLWGEAVGWIGYGAENALSELLGCLGVGFSLWAGVFA